jgi:predicted  nucleic acid-binding Zn-ribbon protein
MKSKMSRWSKRDEAEQPSIEQFELKFQEEVIKWRKRRERGENIDAIVMKPRKLSAMEVRYLEMKAERRALEAELKESGW